MSTKSVTANQCHHINARGRRCRMLIAPTHDSLCAHHLAQSAASQSDAEALAAELLGSLDDFSTADSVNQLLGNLVKQLARKRIARLDAIAMAYMCQLLLNSLPPLKKELRAEQDEEAQISQREFEAEFQAWATAKGNPKALNAPTPQAVPPATSESPS
jgi:hypothetical protein